MFVNNGNGTFTRLNLSDIGMSGVLDYGVLDAHWADFDNDGYLDLYVVRHDVANGANAPNILFLNNGNGTFRDGTAQFNAVGLNTGLGDSVAVADFDRNGFLDAIVANGYVGSRGPYQLLRNVGNENRWIRIVPLGATGSPELGAKVWLWGDGFMQYREYYTNSGSRGSSHEPVVHFGIGGSDQADRIRVQWADGSFSELTNVAANQLIEIRQGSVDEDVSVPNVVGLTQAAAESAITGAGLVVGSVLEQSSETVPAGSVISQDPVGGASVASGTAVNLVVSSGVATVSVPNVVGLTQAAAESAITGAGLVVGRIRSRNNRDVAAGDVFEQTPVAGSIVTSGSTVDLVVSQGHPTQRR